jgi:hypothetical protein
MRPSGDVILTDSEELDCDLTPTHHTRRARMHANATGDDRAFLNLRMVFSTPKRAPSTRAVPALDMRKPACTCQAYSVGSSLSSTK